jgi:hypothetical protein
MNNLSPLHVVNKSVIAIKILFFIEDKNIVFLVTLKKQYFLQFIFLYFSPGTPYECYCNEIKMSNNIFLQILIYLFYYFYNCPFLFL